MCTSLTIQTADQKHLLARTMDFAFELGATISYMPAHYTWQTTLESEDSFTSNYAFIGAGRKLVDTYYFVDGVNEKGLAVAELYYPGEAKYHEMPDDKLTNLTPHELPKWFLGQFASVAEIEQALPTLHIVAQPIALVGVTPPLHYIITDRTGRVCVLESESGELVLKDNPLGVMTNSPDLGWHLKNLNNYLYLSNTGYAEKEFNGVTFSPFGQGNGSFALPGGYTPPERFVRAAFLKETAAVPKNADEGVNSLLHILSSVDIPKGSVIHDNGFLDYTQYTGAMCLEDQTYFIKTYGNPTVYKVALADVIHETHPIEFAIEYQFQSTSLQASV